ncbi:MAG: YbbR-like domain-containing protein [Agathobacter sp.]
MKNKFFKSLFKNFGFKVLAVFFACILWLVVYNTDDPTKTQTFSTKVTIENANAIKNMNKYYEIVEGTGNVTFSVSAQRSVLSKIADSDFTAVADMNDLVMNEDGTMGTVEIKITCGRYENYLNYNKQKYLKVALEDLMEKQFVISASTTGKVAEGYALGDVTISGSNILKVSGPASIVGQIKSAVAIINVDDVSTNVSDNVFPTLLDDAGNVIDTTKLSLSTSTVAINAAVLSTKYLSFTFDTVGTPEAGYEVVSVVGTPNSVRVKGTSSVLNGLTTIAVPGDVFNVDGLKESFETTIDIAEYLPENISLVSNKDGIISVVVTIEPYEEKELTITTDRIDVVGLAEGLQLEYDNTTVDVTVGAVTSVLDTLDSHNVLLALDASELTVGRHRVQLSLADEAASYDLLDAYVEITLTEIEENNENQEEPVNENGQGN